MTQKVLVAEFPGVSSLEWPGLELHLRPELAGDREALLGAIPAYPGLIVRNKVAVDDSLLSAAPALRVIGRLGAGLDNIDLDAARLASVAVVYAPGTSTGAVVEYCLGQVINLMRGIPEAIRSTAEGRWDRTGFRAMELRGSVIGVIGYGRIGQGVAGALCGLGAEVLVYTQPPESAFPPATNADLHSLLARADLVTIHIPGSRGNRAFIGPDEFALMKHGALLLNSSRGTVLDEGSLADALESGRVAAAALDVRDVEPPGRDRLGIMPNVYQTPHLAGLTGGSMERTARSVLSDVAAVLEGRSPGCPAPAQG